MSLKHAVLGLLSTLGPSSGYDLLQHFDISLTYVWPAAQSQLYGELGKLDQAGLVAVVAEGARGRKEYTVTDDGMAELRHWMVDVEPSRVRRNDMLLRVFFFSVLRPDQAMEYLRRRVAAAAESYEELRRVQQEIEPIEAPLAEHGRLALDWGLRYYVMEREWAERAIKELADASDRRPGGS